MSAACVSRLVITTMTSANASLVVKVLLMPRLTLLVMDAKDQKVLLPRVSVSSARFVLLVFAARGGRLCQLFAATAIALFWIHGQYH